MVAVADFQQVLAFIDDTQIDAVVSELQALKARGGRLFTMGNGGGAGHASHAASDFRKIAGIEAYCVSDSVCELTARVNDDGWERAWADWLDASRACRDDDLFVFSVGGAGGSVSGNLAEAMYRFPGTVLGVVGADGGIAAKVGVVVRVPSKSTPIIEGLQSVLHHLIVERLR